MPRLLFEMNSYGTCSGTAGRAIFKLLEPNFHKVASHSLPWLLFETSCECQIRISTPHITPKVKSSNWIGLHWNSRQGTTMHTLVKTLLFSLFGWSDERIIITSKYLKTAFCRCGCEEIWEFFATLSLEWLCFSYHHVIISNCTIYHSHFLPLTTLSPSSLKLKLAPLTIMHVLVFQWMSLGRGKKKLVPASLLRTSEDCLPWIR